MLKGCAAANANVETAIAGAIDNAGKIAEVSLVFFESPAGG